MELLPATRIRQRPQSEACCAGKHKRAVIRLPCRWRGKRLPNPEHVPSKEATELAGEKERHRLRGLVFLPRGVTSFALPYSGSEERSSKHLARTGEHVSQTTARVVRRSFDRKRRFLGRKGQQLIAPFFAPFRRCSATRDAQSTSEVSTPRVAQRLIIACRLPGRTSRRKSTCMYVCINLIYPLGHPLNIFYVFDMFP